MPKRINKKYLWIFGPVASAALGAYLLSGNICCERRSIESILAISVGVLAFVSSVVLMIHRFKTAVGYFRDPKISYPESVMKNNENNESEK